MWQVNTSDVFLRNTVTDPDGDRSNLTFAVWTADADGNPEAPVDISDDNPYDVIVSEYVDSGATAQVNVPPGILKPGETYLFRTSAYDGSLYETEWSPWATFEIFHTVDIDFPEPVTSEPALNQDDYQEFQEAALFDGWEGDDPYDSQPAARTRDGHEECASRKLDDGATVRGCTRITPVDSKKARELLAKARGKVGARIAGLVDSCDALSLEESLRATQLKRFEACIAGTIGVDYEYQKGGQVKHLTGTWLFFDRYKLSGNSSVFHQELTLEPVYGVNQLTGQIRFDVDFRCVDGPCATSTRETTWDGALTWSYGDEHAAVGNTTHTWTGGSQAGAKNLLHLSPKITTYATLPPNVVDDQMPSTGWTAIDAGIRCDTIVRATAGCVFSKYIPTWTFNTRKVPAAAAHAWLIKSTLPNHPGSKKHNAPMYFLPRAERSDNPGHTPQENRDVICPDGWARNHGHPDTSPRAAGDVPSCDEFAFAASYNSGGMPTSQGGLNPVSSGDACLQTYATRVTQGEWHLYNDEREPAPTFTEVCGRSSMSNWVNTTSMSPFSRGFSGKYRLLNRDPYWVSTPGFEHCNADARPVRCTMSMP